MRKKTRPNYYAILGISTIATEGEIKMAYKARALVCHPDKAEESARPAAEESFKLLGEALEILGRRSAFVEDSHAFFLLFLLLCIRDSVCCCAAHTCTRAVSCVCVKSSYGSSDCERVDSVDGAGSGVCAKRGRDKGSAPVFGVLTGMGGVCVQLQCKGVRKSVMRMRMHWEA